MTGGAANANAKQQQQQSYTSTNPLSQLKKGSLVEVCSDEEGFKGAWYVATLLHFNPPPPSSRPRSASAARKRKIPPADDDDPLQAFVQYHSLVAKEGSSKPLREYINADFIRPLPPSETVPCPFQVGDVVDAYYRDGWWTGVITGVLQQGLRFVVTFQNPPDDIDFGLSELRFHREWVNHKWVRPAKQKAAGLMFSVGKRVEVSFDREERRDAWFPATILADIGSGHYLVECQTPSKIGAELLKTTVDYRHMRPCPPRLKDNVFRLLEKVDAATDFGWWSGVITKELADCRYIVYFKHTNKEGEFNHTELRPHMEWNDGNWFTSQDVLKPSDYEKHQGHVCNNVHNTEIVVPVSNSGFEESCSEEKKALSLNLNEVDNPAVNEESPRLLTSLTERTQDLPSLSGNEEILTEELALATPSPRVNPTSAIKIVSAGKTRLYEIASLLPETTGNSLSNQSLDGDQSDNHTWGKRVKRKRMKIYEEDTTSSGKTNSSIRTMQDKSPPNVVEGREGNAVEDVAEVLQEDRVTVQTNLPVVLGLECEKGSNSAKKPYHSSGEESMRLVGNRSGLNYNEPLSVKDGNELDSQEKVKKRRGRPPKGGVIKGSITSPTEEPSVDAIPDELLVKDFISGDIDSLKDVEVKSANIDFSVPGQEFFINGNGQKRISNQEKHKNKTGSTDAMLQRRKLSEITAEASIKQQERHSSKRGRKRTVNVNIVSQFQGKPAESNYLEDIELVSEEVPVQMLDDQPLSKWFQEVLSPTTNDAGSRISPARSIEQCGVASNGQLEIAEEEILADVKSQSAGSSAGQSLPFVKNTLLWATLESMEVFKKFPQKPHFQPLEQHKESSREGLAIGYMVNFTTVVDRASRLKFDDPKSATDDILETLSELESHGFDVEVVRDRITGLVSMKEKQEEMKGQLGKLGGEIKQQKLEKAKIEEEMEDIKKQTTVLEEKLALAVSAKESKELEIAFLQSKLEGVKEGIRGMESDFEGLLASSLT